MKKVTISLVAGSLLALAGPALADSVVEFWACTLQEGKTIADVQAVNKSWLAYVHENVSEDISSSVATSIVDDGGSFMFVDSYPDLATWAAAKKALNTDEGNAIEAQFAELSECNSNRLWNVQSTPE